MRIVHVLGLFIVLMAVLVVLAVLTGRSVLDF